DLIDSPQTPYQKFSDGLRDFTYQGCRWWHAQLGAGSPPSLTRCMTLADIAIRKQQREDDEQTVKGLEDESNHLDPRNWNAFLTNVLFARANVPPDMQHRVQQIMNKHNIEDL